MKNKLKIPITLLAVMFTAAACGAPQKPTQKIELVWWSVFADADSVRVLIKEFEPANPGVSIKFVKKNIETYEDELVNALAAGTGPDLFSIHNDWLPKHWDKMAPAAGDVIG